MPFPQPYNTVGYPGSVWAATFQFFNSDGSLMNITGKTFEYVIRTSVHPGGTSVVSVNTTPTANGSIVVTTTNSSILVTLTPTATGLLAIDTTYAATLWMDPNLTDATVMATGAYTALGTAAP